MFNKRKGKEKRERERERKRLTIWVPDISEEPHRRRRKRIVLWKLEFGREHTTLEWRALRPLDQTLPMQEIIFRDGPRGDTFGRVVCQSAVFLEEAAVRCRLGHDVGWLGTRL